MSEDVHKSYSAPEQAANREALTRRQFVKAMGSLGASLAFSDLAGAQKNNAAPRPNVVLIITDDQGWGDLGCHGNDKIKTPNLDRLCAQSVELTRFYVCPVCSPTRACLMTGRYNYRTGVVDTYLGRSMMYPEEQTIAEMLRAAGYRTGIFGKWHLGDTYPMRPIDQGFEEAVVHNGGGLGQPSDPPGNSYFDPILQHNGVPQRYRGYCTDIFTSEAIKFIEKHRAEPFFVYLATNAPHAPLQIADSYVEPYLKMGLDEKTAKFYGMVTNIDENVGRLLRRLRELGLEQNTIVIFLTDNGPSRGHYTVGGLRGTKGTVYEGGLRVPFFIRWPARLAAGKKIDTIAAHIDLAPTLLEACGAPKPPDVAFDGKSLMPLLLGEAQNWPERTIFAQWHRGDVPEKFRACAAITQRYKLVNGNELYDLQADPGEKQNIADKHPDIVARLRQSYERWFDDVSATRGYDPPRIFVGTEHENPTILTRQDWRGAAGWSNKDLGFWEIDVRAAGRYELVLRFPAAAEGAQAQVRVAGVERAAQLARGDTWCIMRRLNLPAGPARVEAWIAERGKRRGVSYVEVFRLGQLRGAEYVPPRDNPDLPRVLIIGDSISIGYTIPLRWLLLGEANVHRIPENGGPTIRGLESLDRWLGANKWHVIHFNWGLHDLKMDRAGKRQVPLEQYKRNLAALVARLKATGARLIWAATTPVPEGNLTPPRKNSDVIAYNEAAREIMEKNGVAIDDLYAAALPRLEEIQLPENVHFTRQGYEFLARAVAQAIRAAL